MSSESPRLRAVSWRLRTQTLDCSTRPLVMGIVNVTPDSFSDGGRCFDPQMAVEHALQLAAEGADILDFGGESTRPYAEAVDAAQELRRVLPVIEAVRKQAAELPLSIDTSKATVARAALDAGVEIINDVTALTGDAEMLPLAVESGAGVCAMHMRGTPQTMQDDPRYGDLIGEIKQYLAERRDALEAAGVARKRICLDPGVGFGKTHEHNWTLLRRCGEFLDLGCPILIGCSRKGFLGKLLGDPAADRDAATAGASIACAVRGVHALRVHNVALVRQVLAAFLACGPDFQSQASVT